MKKLEITQSLNKLFFLSLFVFLGGCAALPYNQPPPKQQSLIPQKEITAVIKASGPWRSSGAYVKKGNKYKIKAVGRWRTGGTFFDQWCAPDGIGANSMFNIIKGYTSATLIARIRNNPPFAVGSSLMLEPHTDGLLFFRMNDSSSGDCQGQVEVIVKNITTKPTLAEIKPLKPLKVNNFQGITANRRVGNFWAVIIGISNYYDTRIPSLRYASSDANSFYNWIVSPDGGKYSPSHVKILLDTEADFKNIRNSLFVWLNQALEEDVVTIYFAGHGSPDSPDTPNNLFLLPHDAQYNNIATTGFPMWDIETALKRFIKAKKVLVIADACHSGGVGQSFDIARRANRGIKINPISSGIQKLSQVGDGVCVISASSNKQFSQESQKWGGGHGVFTYFLLKGLKGDADYNKDTSVTLGELTSFLSEQVRRETRNAQSPTVAGRYDPALTIGK